MTAIQFRQYQPGDEAAIAALWNECLRHDPITPMRLRNLVLLDANFDSNGLRLAFEGDRLVGALYGVRRLLPMHGIELEPSNGWITFFFVAPDRRRQGIGTRLMGEALDFFERYGRVQVYFSSYAPNYLVPGIDDQSYPEGYAFLQRHGFTRVESPVAMDVSLVDYAPPGHILALKRQRIEEGSTFELATDRDLVEVIQFATNVFSADWGRAIREGILRGLPLTAIHIARESGKLVGFCMHGSYEGVRERFGPFGVDPLLQGRGLGKILLHDCLTSMRAQGLHGAWFMWTEEDEVAGHLYKKSGFRVSRRFHIMCRRAVGK